MVVCKFGAPLWCRMIDVYRKEFNNKFDVLINWRKWKWHQLTSRFTGSICGCSQVDYPAGTGSEQKPVHSWLILIHINSDERGLMTSGWARASSAFIRKGQFGRPTLSQRRAAVLSAKVGVSQYVNSRDTEKKSVSVMYSAFCESLNSKFKRNRFLWKGIIVAGAAESHGGRSSTPRSGRDLSFKWSICSFTSTFIWQ